MLTIQYLLPLNTENTYGLSGRANSFSIPASPNGLACCPHLFTKLLKPVYASLRQTGDEIVPYIDDSYLQGDTEQECWQSVKKTALLLQDLGFIIHPDKSVFLPKRVLTFLGFVINSIDMTVQLTPAKANHLREACTKLLNAQHPTIRDVAQVIGLLVSSAPAGVCFLPNTGE